MNVTLFITFLVTKLYHNTINIIFNDTVFIFSIEGGVRRSIQHPYDSLLVLNEPEILV